MTATDDAPGHAEIGKDRRRKEDQRLITGRTRWTDNITLPGHAAPGHGAQPVRPREDHQRSTPPRRKAAPNVVAVLTGEDLDDEQGVVHQRLADHPRPGHARPPADAVDRVAFAGEIVAVVVARTAAEARDAAELVDVEYDELPGRARPQGGRRRTRCSPTPTSAPTSPRSGVFDSAEAGTGGNVDEAIAKARADGIVIEREYRQQRLIPAFMEPRSVVVDPTGEQITDVVGDPDPAHPAVRAGRHDRRPRVEDPGDRPRRRRRLRRQAPGHARGVDRLARSARRLGKPVQVHRDPLGVADGGPPRPRPVAEADPGGRPRTARSPASRSTCSPTSAPTSRIVGGGVPVLGAFMFNAIYKFPAYQFTCQTVLTNKTWTDAYRGAGRPEATYAIERMMDELAVEVGVDPLEIREKNWIKHEEFPFTTVAGLTYDSGNYEAATAKAKEMFGYDELRAEQKQRRDVERPGPARHRRLDVHRDVRPGAVAGCSAASTTAPAAGSTPSVRMLADRQGRGRHRRQSPHGQGHETAFSQIVADRLGVPFEDVEVLHGDTADRATRAWTPTARGRWWSAARRWSRRPTR